MRKTSLLVLAALVAAVQSADAVAATTTAATTCTYNKDCTTADQCCLVSQSDVLGTDGKTLASSKVTAFACGAKTDAKDDTTTKVVKTCFDTLAKTAAKSYDDCVNTFGTGYVYANLVAADKSEIKACVPSAGIDKTTKAITLDGAAYTATVFPTILQCKINTDCQKGESCSEVTGKVGTVDYKNQACVKPDAATNKNLATSQGVALSINYNRFDCHATTECQSWYGNNACCMLTQPQTQTAAKTDSTAAVYADDKTGATYTCYSKSLSDSTIPVTSTTQLSFECQNGLYLQAGIAVILAMLSILA